MYFGKEGEVLDSRMPAAQWVLLMASAIIMVVGVVNLFGVEGAAAVAAEVLVR
jgi:NADH-quinone oxidoreductase subunit N